MRSGRLDSPSLHTGSALAVLLSAVAIGGIAASAFLVSKARRDGWLDSAVTQLSRQ